MEISVQDLEFVYSPGTPLELVALAGVSFRIPQSSVLGILGGTGSGKTTLVKNLNGLLVPTHGRVLLNGKDIRSYGPSLRREVGVVFQRPERNLFEETVYRDISFVLRRTPGLGDAEIYQRVEDACRLMGLSLDDVGDCSPMGLSDAQKRKVAVAGILVNNPKVLILDEPAVGLDPPSLVDLIDVLRKMKDAENRTLVIVSHDMYPFLPLLDLMLVLKQGKVSAFGTRDEVCAALRDDPVMREFLPDPTLLVTGLREAESALSQDETDVQELPDGVVNIPLWSGGTN